MRAVRSTLPLLAVALVFVGCNGGDSANVAGGNTPAPSTNAPANVATNTAPTNDPAANTPIANSATTNAGPTNTAATPDAVGIQTTKPGTGAGAKDGDVLAMRYTGRLTSGEEFDSNATGDPFNLVLGAGSVIRGWEEGLQGVKVGEKRTLMIPSVKGYGPQGSGKIPPNADLVFDIECLYIVPAEKQDVIQREALKTGSGATIKSGQTVTFHFRGTLLSGKEFDSSYKVKKPLSVKIGSASLEPAGLEDAMVGMRVGGKYRLTFPPAIGFGATGNRSGSVPGNSIVFFEIEPLSAK